MYLTAVNTDSNLAAFSSPTDGVQIMSNEYLFSTSAFSYFESNIQFPTTLIALFTFFNESINWTKLKSALMSYKILYSRILLYFIRL